MCQAQISFHSKDATTALNFVFIFHAFFYTITTHLTVKHMRIFLKGLFFAEFSHSE